MNKNIDRLNRIVDAVIRYQQEKRLDRIIKEDGKILRILKVMKVK